MGRRHALIYCFGSLNGYYTLKYIAAYMVKGSLTRRSTNIGVIYIKKENPCFTLYLTKMLPPAIQSSFGRL